MDKEVHLHNGIFSSIQFSRSVVYYSATEKNEIMPLAATWIDLEIIIMSEVREGQRKTNIIVIQSLSCV